MNLQHIILLSLAIGLSSAQDTLWLGGGGSLALQAESGTEALDVSGSGASCSSLPPLPQETYGAVGARTGCRPVFCGGQDRFDKYNGCYIYRGDSWQILAEMNMDRREASIFQLTNNDFIVVGGWNLRHQRTTEVFTAASNAFTAGKVMPYGVDQACAAPINSTHFIISGGETDMFPGTMTNQSLIYNVLIQSFEPIAEFGLARGNHGCGSVEGPDGLEFVIAGGSDVDGTVLDSVEIYNVGTDTWRQGNPLPWHLTGPGSDQLGDSFIISGGFDDISNTVVPTILEYEAGSDSWKTRSEGIGGFFLGKGHHGSVVVDDTTLNVC